MSQMKILIAEDNVDSNRLLQLRLRKYNAEVLSAFDGIEAVKLAEQHKPDIILMDIGMPELDGLAAGKQIKDTDWGQKIKLVALTGWGQEEDYQKTKEAGFDAHLVKPISEEDLNQVLK